MKQVSTDGNLIAITTYERQTSDIVFEQLGNRITPVIKQDNERTYLVSVEGCDESTWADRIVFMQGGYEGRIDLYGQSFHFEELAAGSLDNVLVIPKFTMDSIIGTMCKVKVDRVGVKAVYSTYESPTEQLGLDINRIRIPLIVENWRNNDSLMTKINELDNNPTPELHYKKYTYKNRHMLNRSIMKGLIRSGCTKDEIVKIYNEYNLILTTSKDWHFENLYELAHVDLNRSVITKQIYSLYGQVRITGRSRITTTGLLHSLLGLAFSKNTLDVRVTKSYLRRIAGIITWDTLEVHLTKLVKMGFLKIESYQKVNDKTNVEFNRYVFHITRKSVDDMEKRGFDVLKFAEYPTQFYTNMDSELNAKQDLGVGYTICALLQKDGLKKRDIAKKLEWKVETTRYHLKKLVKKGIVKTHTEDNALVYTLSSNHLDIIQNIYVTRLLRVKGRVYGEIGSLQDTNTENPVYRILKRQHGRDIALTLIKEASVSDKWNWTNLLKGRSATDISALITQELLNEEL